MNRPKVGQHTVVVSSLARDPGGLGIGAVLDENAAQQLLPGYTFVPRNRTERRAVARKEKSSKHTPSPPPLLARMVPRTPTDDVVATLPRCARCGMTLWPRDEIRDPGASLRTEILRASLEAAVPIAIHDLRYHTWEELQRLASESSTVIASHGDDLQFGGKKCASTFAALARGLAALAYAPGGVTFLGLHWCAVHRDAATRDGQYGVTA